MNKWKETETKKGILKYRMPNVAEGFEFLSKIQKIENAQGIFKIKGQFAAMMGEMILFKDLGYESYDDFLSDTDNNFKPLSIITEEVFVDITKALGKKN